MFGHLTLVQGSRVTVAGVRFSPRVLGHPRQLHLRGMVHNHVRAGAHAEGTESVQEEFWGEGGGEQAVKAPEGGKGRLPGRAEAEGSEGGGAKTRSRRTLVKGSSFRSTPDPLLGAGLNLGTQ